MCVLAGLTVPYKMTGPVAIQHLPLGVGCYNRRQREADLVTVVVALLLQVCGIAIFGLKATDLVAIDAVEHLAPWYVEADGALESSL